MMDELSEVLLDLIILLRIFASMFIKEFGL
jgi:hypothetical protein